MKPSRKPLWAAALSLSVGCPAIAHATNGMFLIGHGTNSRGMGGTAIAYPLDSLAGAANPATISAFNTRADVGIDYFSPEAWSSIIDANGDRLVAESKADQFLIPHMGGAMRLRRARTPPRRWA